MSSRFAYHARLVVPMLVLFAACNTARAELVQHGFVLEASTLGLGGDYVIGLGDHFQVRVGGNKFNYNYDLDGTSSATEGELDYNGDLELASLGPTVDWYPTGNSFRLSVGLHWNDNKLANRATCNDPGPNGCAMGFGVFDSLVLGTIYTDITFAEFAPYIGVGLGNPMKQQGFSFLIDIGVLFQGSPDVSLRSDGACNSDPTCAAAIESEEKELKDELKGFRFYPVLNLALGYRF